MDPLQRYANLLQADGTNQLQRLLPGLDADYIVPDERSLSDLVQFASQLGAQIRFYDLSGQAAGSWGPFLEALFDSTTHEVLAPDALETLLASRDDWPAHLVMFLVFLKLFANIQQDMNQLTVAHLSYFYQSWLGLGRRAPQPDEVYAIFGLARNASTTLLKAGTLLDAGKDTLNRPLSYATESDVTVSSAAVAGMKRLVVDHDLSLRRRFFIADAFTPLEGTSGYTFGRTQLDLDPSQRFMTEAPLGFAIAAPILAMEEGTRTVTLTAVLSPPSGAPALVSQGIGYAIAVDLTGAKGWLTPDTVQGTLTAGSGTQPPTLSVTVSLSPTLPAVIPFDPNLHGPGLSAADPVLRFLVKGESGLYETLDGYVVGQVSVTVGVQGVRDLVVQNSDGPLNSSQPMPLFGSTPQIGSAFYIGSTEIFSKKLRTLSLNYTWKSPPPDLFNWYQAYFDLADTSLQGRFTDLFRTEVSLLYNRSFQTLLSNQILFAPNPTDPQQISAGSTAFDTAFAGLDYEAQPDLGALDSFTASSKFGFLRLVLTNPTQFDTSGNATTVPFDAFGHSAFPRRYAYQAIALSKSTAPPTPQLPNQPYTPTLSTLSLDYTATTEFVPGDIHAAETYLSFGPFGATAVSDAVPAAVVPPIDAEAALYLGFSNLPVPGNLALFFDIDAGTADASPVLQPGDTQWSYLGEGDAWQALPASAVLTDSTQGFQKPGVISVSVPPDATVDHQGLPTGLVWLRASINKPPQSASRTNSILPHAALAQFQPGSLPLTNYEQHLDSTLAAGTITRLLQRNANIKTVTQPEPSSGGLGQESDTGYFDRCSERLRHRKRAVTAWDYERLVLQAFPEVYKVKCLPYTDADGATRAGHTALVIIPDLQGTDNNNPLQPSASDVLLEDIADSLADLTSPYATLHVIRPVFEQIRVVAQVTFAAGKDPGYYSGVLNDDLKRFLSPWAYEDGQDILFGARIYRSEILAFMEGRDYVDHLVDVDIFHSFSGPSHDGIGWKRIAVDFVIQPDPHPAVSEMTIGTDFIVGRPVEYAETTQPQAILVSHSQHLITAVLPGTEVCPGITQLGIGYMTVDLDFQVEDTTV